jgi:hypothetical protein
MIDAALAQLVDGGWITAAGRILFVLLIYGFLYLVFRNTVAELTVVAQRMGPDDGQPARATLIVEDRGESTLRQGESLQLPLKSTIGRGPGNVIVIADPHVSAQHATLWFERGQWWLRDLESSNGTLLNGEPVRTVVAVRNDDVLQCGRVRLRFVSTITVPSERASA